MRLRDIASKFEKHIARWKTCVSDKDLWTVSTWVLWCTHDLIQGCGKAHGAKSFHYFFSSLTFSVGKAFLGQVETSLPEEYCTLFSYSNPISTRLYWCQYASFRNQCSSLDESSGHHIFATAGSSTLRVSVRKWIIRLVIITQSCRSYVARNVSYRGQLSACGFLRGWRGARASSIFHTTLHFLSLEPLKFAFTIFFYLPSISVAS